MSHTSGESHLSGASDIMSHHPNETHGPDAFDIMSQPVSETQDLSASDLRPDPKPRKHPHLWQAYLWWYELVEMRKRHTLRMTAAERGKSNFDAEMERAFMNESFAVLSKAGIPKWVPMDLFIDHALKEMAAYGQAIGPIWNWCTDIRGMGPSLTAQLLAQIDDIGRFDNVSKLWRFAGYAVMEGKAEKNQRGEKSHYNARLKGVCFNIADQFIRHQTPGYVDLYYAEKARQRRNYPVKLKQDNGKYIYTDAHLHNRAWRKMVKQFLADLWLAWRQADGLPVTDKYVPDGK